MDLDLNLSGDFEYYLREILSGTTKIGLNFMREQNFYFIALIISHNSLVYQNSS